MENVQEVWKDIKGYPNYQISNLGNVWSVKRQRKLNPFINNRGYKAINIIAANGKRKGELIHRLVALAFIDNPEGKPEVNHIDKNKENNNVENLEWVTHGENNSLEKKGHYTHKKNN